MILNHQQDPSKNLNPSPVRSSVWLCQIVLHLWKLFVVRQRPHSELKSECANTILINFAVQAKQKQKCDTSSWRNCTKINFPLMLNVIYLPVRYRTSGHTNKRRLHRIKLHKT